MGKKARETAEDGTGEGNIDHPGRQAEQEQDGGGIHQQLVLGHVRAEEETFGDLVERRADGEVEEEQAKIKAHGVTARERGARRRQAVAPRTRQDRPQPAQKDKPANQMGFVVPMSPVDHVNAVRTEHGVAAVANGKCLWRDIGGRKVVLRGARIRVSGG